MNYETTETILNLAPLLMFVVYPLLALTVMAFLVYALWQGAKALRGIAAALRAIGKINAEMREQAKGTAPAPEAAPEEEADDEEEGEAPADFVYCPECSTRLEADPSIRNITVVCPDCKKPFHIH